MQRGLVSPTPRGMAFSRLVRLSRSAALPSPFSSLHPPNATPRRSFSLSPTPASTLSDSPDLPPSSIPTPLPHIRTVPPVDPMLVPIPNPGSRAAKAAFKAASQSTSPYRLSHSDVRAAYQRISPIVNKSPLDFSPRLSQACGAQIYLKKEHVSIVGSYKERGALNKLLQLTQEERARGVICSSAGNHAQAVAYHSTRLGVDGVIVMPKNAPHVKVMRVKEFGGKVVQAGESFAEAYEAALTIAKEEGRTFIHAFNDNQVIAGQGVSSTRISSGEAFHQQPLPHLTPLTSPPTSALSLTAVPCTV